MLAEGEERPGPSHQLLMLADACAFGRRTWVQAMIDATEAGHVQLYWTPTIIEEMARLRQLLWIRNWMIGGGTRLTTAVRRQLLDDAHKWMDYVRPHFHVVEDRPAHVPAWQEPYRGQPEAPIWVAARTAGVDVIVTANLAAGPPANERGLQIFENVLYLDPECLPAFLDRWGDICQAGAHIVDLPGEPGDTEAVAAVAGPHGGVFDPMPGLVEFLLDVVRRRSATLAPATAETAESDAAVQTAAAPAPAASTVTPEPRDSVVVLTPTDDPEDFAAQVAALYADLPPDDEADQST